MLGLVIARGITPTGVRRIALVALVVAALGAGCGGGDRTSGAKAGRRPEVAALPPLAEPAPALRCDGSHVLCVDARAAGGDGNGSADRPFASISAALVAARPSAVIQVAAGQYAEAVVIKGASDLRLIGGFPNGDFSRRDPAANETVVRGTAERSVVAIVGSSGVRVEGFHLTGGGGNVEEYRLAGGGVFADETSKDVSIVANRIDGNAIDHGKEPGTALGGGVGTFSAGTTKIVGNVIEGNRAGRGGAIAAGTDDGEIVVDRNTVRGNTGVGDHGGGIYLNGKVTVTGNRVEGNRVEFDYGWGAGILVYGDDSSAALRGNVVTGNRAPSAGSGVFIDDGADATLANELYYDNECAADGGNGLFVDSGGKGPTVVHVVNSTIAQHDCPKTSLGGNAILAEISEATAPVTVVTLTGCILWGNAGEDVGSAGADVKITNSIVEEPLDDDKGVTADSVRSEDPLFVDPAGGDFRLRDASPAAGLGHSAQS